MLKSFTSVGTPVHGRKQFLQPSKSLIPGLFINSTAFRKSAFSPSLLNTIQKFTFRLLCHFTKVPQPGAALITLNNNLVFFPVLRACQFLRFPKQTHVSVYLVPYPQGATRIVPWEAVHMRSAHTAALLLGLGHSQKVRSWPKCYSPPALFHQVPALSFCNKCSSSQ